MSYLILSQPSEEYAQAVSHELWMLARPRGISDSETSQYFCGVQKHTDGRVSIGPLDGVQPIHKDADELSFGAKIGQAVTEAEKEGITQAIIDAKGGSISILSIIEASPSLSPNLRTYDQLEADGWFTTEEL
jgi:hypothetical protein